MKSKLCTAAEAVEKYIAPGSTVAVSGNMKAGVASETLKALRAAFDEKGAPGDLTVIAGSTPALDIVAAKGLVKRVVAGSYAFAPEMGKLVVAGDVEGYSLPQGVIAHVFRDVCNRNGGLATKVGIGTLADPRVAGGKINAKAQEDIVSVKEIMGTEQLYYKAPKIDVTILRATSVDERGNASFKNEPSYSFAVEAAMAAKACGGKVIVECRDYVKEGTLSATDVRLAHIFVDAIVPVENIDESYVVSEVSGFNRAVLGETKLACNPGKVLENGPEKVVARRAASELTHLEPAFVCAGAAAHVSDVVSEEGAAELVQLSSESGANGGVLCDGEPFGIEVNFTSLLDEPTQYDYLHCGAVTTAFLSPLQVDGSGKINVSRLGSLVAGCGPAIDAVFGAGKVVLCGKFGDVSAADASSLFAQKVEEATIDGMFEVSQGKKILLVTEVAVFELGAGGWTLVEIAEGKDAAADVAAHIPFGIKIAPDVKTMDARLFAPEPMGLAEQLA